MNREDFRLIAAGQFAYCISAEMPSVDVGQMRTYVDGAMFAFDMLRKLSNGTVSGHITTRISSLSIGEEEEKRLRILYGNTLD